MNSTFPLLGVIGAHNIGGRYCSMHSGKDQFCSTFISSMRSLGVHYTRRAFGDAVKEDLAKMLGVTVEYINENKPHFRLMMQGYATDYARQLLGRDYWTTRFSQYQQNSQLSLLAAPCFVVPDVRFADECEFIKNAGGMLVRINRMSSVNYPLDSSVTTHESERAVFDLPFDTEIVNTDIQEFELATVRFAHQLFYAYTQGKLNVTNSSRQTISRQPQPNCACH